MRYHAAPFAVLTDEYKDIQGMNIEHTSRIGVILILEILLMKMQIPSAQISSKL